MKATLSKPYLLTWLAIPVLLLTGHLFGQHTIDVQLYDTYFVIANGCFVLAASLFLLGIGVGCWLVSGQGRLFNAALTTLHLLPTIGLLLLIAVPLPGNTVASSDRLVWKGAVLLVAQCLYPINLFVAGLQRKRVDHHR